MKTNSAVPATQLADSRLSAAERGKTQVLRLKLRVFVLFSIVLIGCFLRPLYELARFAWHSDLYSHILLLPVISGYLIRLKKPTLTQDSAPQPAMALLPLVAGLAALSGYWWATNVGWKFRPDDYLALMVAAFLSFLLSGAFLFVGPQLLRQVAFPVGLLLFMVPFPSVLLHGIESLLQHRSADVADMLFTVAGTPALREGTFFQLPGMPLEVAPECSGVHSTLVLFITSLVAGYLFLRAPWKRAVLALSVIPLALLRNGFRIFTIGELCVHIDPEMIHSPIHRHGGPLFFVLSLIPFFLILLLLRRGENANRALMQN